MSAPRRLVPFALGAGAVAVTVLIASAVLGSGNQRTVDAEFQNVRGLIAHNEVLVNGAKVGTVSSITLTKRGTAMVTMHINKTVQTPRADAAATVRPVDLLGDIYLDYSPGTASQPLRGPIPLSRTANVPRLADLLRAFTPGARAGAQALIVALGAGLESRGFDLNRAAVELRPALAATDQVTSELSSQNATLRSLIANSAHLTGQLATRSPDLSGMVTDFAHTLAATAAHAPQLDRGLTQLAPTVTQLGKTTGELATTATALRPLAVQIGAAASPLTNAFRNLSPFLRDAQAAVQQTRPTIRDAATFLNAGAPTFAALTTGLQSGLSAAPQANSLLTTLTSLTPLVSDALFQNIASETSEPGNQPTTPSTDPLRNYWRGAAVLSCESFGLPITPGCLSALAVGRHASSRRVVADRPARTPRAPAQPRLPAINLPTSIQNVLKGSTSQGLAQTVQRLPQALQNLPQGALNSVTGRGSQPAGPPVTNGQQAHSNTNGLNQLLKYLLGP